MNKYIISELQELVRENVITSETAENISIYFKRKERESTNPLTITLAILGALLVGSGIILLVAHNWDDFSKTVRTILAFLPLIVSQLLGIYTLLRRKLQQAWTESAAVLLFLSMGAAMALISQIYQINGSLSTFLLTWTAVSIPLVYIFSSSTLAVLCISSLSWYAFLIGYDGSHQAFPMLYLVGMVCLLPYYRMLLNQKPLSNFLVLLNWAFAISIVVVLGTFTRFSYSRMEWIGLLYCTLFCLFVVIGRTNYFHSKSILRNSFLLIGLPGLLVMLFVWSFSHSLLSFDQEFSMAGDPLLYLCVIMAVLIIFLTYRIARQDKSRISPDIFSFVVFYLCIRLLQTGQFTGTLIINLMIFVIACYYIWKGARFNNLPVMNFGLIVFALLAIFRFFDEEIPFLFRGLLFVAAGAGFFAANLLVIKKRKKLSA